MRPLPDLPRHLHQLLAQVPVGRVTTYGVLAEALGDRLASRWVGHFLLNFRHAPDPASPTCPCHRVVRFDGTLGDYVAGGPAAKQTLLTAEGVSVRRAAVDLETYGFSEFRGERPLDALREEQQQTFTRVVVCRPRNLPEMVGGVDVSYARGGDGVAAYTLVEIKSGRLVWWTTVRQRVEFPYIQSFLTFRELPILLELIDQVRAAGRLAEVVLVDGSGLAHHRHVGIASHFGVAAELPTIGVTKKLLCGSIEPHHVEPGAVGRIVHAGEVVGTAIRSRAPAGHTLYVSPGHRVDVPFAAGVVTRLLRGHRLPEPLYWADRLSRAEARKLCAEATTTRSSPGKVGKPYASCQIVRG